MKRFLLHISSCAVGGLLLGTVLLIGACDSSLTGSAFENQAPSTELAVRDTSLVDNLGEAGRLTSTVSVSWSGTDPDGYVASFELRYYNASERPAPEDGWMETTRNDTLILLPIERGRRTANVAFEVRAVDNDGLRDPDPARTVFPIENSPPTIRFSSFDLPPDTTFTIFTMSWTADDPEGEENLDRVEISLNDSTSFVALDPTTDFVTFVADFDADDPAGTVTEAELYLGRSFQSSGIMVPNLRLDEENTLYLRAVDRTDTTSTLQRFTWHVRKPEGRVLFVNDYRRSSWPVVQDFHLSLLREYLPAGIDVDVWNISQPYTTGSSGNRVRSDALPPHASPTLRETLAMWDYIYWISANATGGVAGNNLPYAAQVMDPFFDQGGKLMVHTPMIPPADPQENLGNPALLVLPLSEAITLPDSVRRIELSVGAAIEPAEDLPGVSETLPALVSDRFFISELPFASDGENVVTLYEADYAYRTQSGGGAWPDPRTIASISADRRVALFALPLVGDQSGEPALVGADGDPEAGRRAVKLILQSLGFPQ